MGAIGYLKRVVGNRVFANPGKLTSRETVTEMLHKLDTQGIVLCSKSVGFGTLNQIVTIRTVPTGKTLYFIGAYLAEISASVNGAKVTFGNNAPASNLIGVQTLSNLTAVGSGCFMYPETGTVNTPLAIPRTLSDGVVKMKVTAAASSGSPTGIIYLIGFEV